MSGVPNLTPSRVVRSLRTVFGGRPAADGDSVDRGSDESHHHEQTTDVAGDDTTTSDTTVQDDERGSTDADDFPVGSTDVLEEAESTVQQIRGCSKTELLLRTGWTPERYLVEILSDAGGQMRQQSLIQFTGWSSTKMSRYLSQMEEDGRIRRIRVGCEKTVFLPDAVPAGAESPFEDVDGFGDDGLPNGQSTSNDASTSRISQT